jgi:hypothetical protein
MSDQNKDSLENFFKKGAQNYDIEFREGDWKKMEALLDSEMPVAFSFSAFLKKIWPLIALLLVIPIGWYSFDRISGSEAGELDIEYQKENTKINPSNANDRLLEQQNTHDQLVVSQSQPDPEIFTRNFASPYDLKSGSASSGTIFIEAKPGKKVKKENDVLEASGKSGELSSTGIIEQGTSNSDNLVYRAPGMLIPIFPGSSIGSLDDPGDVESKPVIENEGNTRFKVSFSLGAGFSPDFSTVGMGNFVSPGIRWNFLAEVGVSRRFMINTGITWVNNKYEAKGEDYHAPPRYWKKGIAADEAYGECVMLDIPLNVRYNFLISERHQFFISGGASTYVLLQEDYYFEYEVEDPELPEHWGTDKVSVYPFKIVNFSIGYQYQLGRKGALQVEPFIKIPTAGVGWGEVNLQTLGVYFMYKYRLGR